jgi:hypothetical protein
MRRPGRAHEARNAPTSDCLDAECWGENPLSPQPVRNATAEQEAGDDADGIYGEHDLRTPGFMAWAGAWA